MEISNNKRKSNDIKKVRRLLDSLGFVCNSDPTAQNLINGQGLSLTNGAQLWLGVTIDPNCEQNKTVDCPGYCGQGGIDVNGNKGPNRLGYDIYTIIINVYNSNY